jgi:hypothetical protein
MTGHIWLSLLAAVVLAGHRGSAEHVIPINVETTPGERTVAISVDDYKKAVAAGYWIIGGEAPGPAGATGRWLWCIEVGDIKRQNEDNVTVEAGNRQWAWDDYSGRNSCSALPHSLQPIIVD